MSSQGEECEQLSNSVVRAHADQINKQIERDSKRKRKAPNCLEMVSERLAKRSRLLGLDTLSVPLLSAREYQKARKSKDLYITQPASFLAWEHILKYNLQGKAALGGEEGDRGETFIVQHDHGR